MQYNGEEQTAFKYGKVHNFNGLTGEIVSEEHIYYFDKDDILNNELLKNDDLVRFNGKNEDVFPQAYFITKKMINRTK